ncbi:MAG: hypothetical protein U0166_11760 [Acidobacteriota bacterium]
MPRSAATFRATLVPPAHGCRGSVQIHSSSQASARAALRTMMGFARPRSSKRISGGARYSGPRGSSRPEGRSFSATGGSTPNWAAIRTAWSSPPPSGVLAGRHSSYIALASSVSCAARGTTTVLRECFISWCHSGQGK